MLSKLIAHVVFQLCCAVDDAEESRGYLCVNAPCFDSTSCSGDSAVTRSFRFSFTYVKLLPTMAKVAARPYIIYVHTAVYADKTWTNTLRHNKPRHSIMVDLYGSTLTAILILC